jgi:hypothetical protein
MDDSDLRDAIQPKSDQINADDLIAGPKTIRITRVVKMQSGEQRVHIYFEGDNGKPWKPCITMTRVLVEAWGPDSKQFVGRSVTIYRNPKVKWAGLEVGGIEISHLSHIERDFVTAVTVTKGKRKGHLVKVLHDAPKSAAKTKVTESAPAVPEKVSAGAKKLMTAVAACETIDSLLALLGSDESRKQIAYLKDKYPSVHVEVANVISATRRTLEGPSTREPGED